MTDPLLSPFSIKHLTLRNRIASTSHEPAYAEQGMPLERYQAYHEEKARGGIGLTMIGGSANVDIDSPSIFGQLDLGRDEIVPHLRRLAERVHAHGAAVMSQITHMGRRTRWDIGDFLPTISPSTIREPAHRSYPKSMEKADIDRVVRAFGRAAARAQAGGLDGVEVCAHAGHLVDQFWSPCQNVREDEYGGSLENRTRFALEVLSEIRRCVGEEFIVGIRMSADDHHHPGGNGPDGAIAIGQLLAASGLVDFLSVTGGSALDDRQLADQIPSFGAPMANYLDAATRFGKGVPLPILHAGRIADLPTARHALAMGGVDLVGMTRAHIADPHIGRKLERGDESRIRPCVGASYCISRIYEGKDALCLHNPATGRESQVPQLVPRTNWEQHVVVVGAGPGGLEAARAAAEAGHRVTLLDAASKVGGQLLLFTRASDRHRELLSIVEWLHSECRLLGVTLKLNTYVEATDVLALEPDTVIVATGGMPITPDLPGAESLSVSTWSVLSGEVRPGNRVLVVDVDGSDETLATAEYLAFSGRAVQIATPDRLVGHDVGGTYYPDYLRSLYKLGVTLTPDVELIELNRSSDGVVAVLRNLYSGKLSTATADSVVAAYGTEPMDELYRELVDCSVNAGEADLPALVTGGPQRIVRNPDGRFRLFRIGDAVAHRNVHAAMLDARRVVLGIG